MLPASHTELKYKCCCCTKACSNLAQPQCLIEAAAHHNHASSVPCTLFPQLLQRYSCCVTCKSSVIAVTCQLWRGKTRCAMLMYAVLPACQTCTAQLQDDHSWRQLKQCRQDPGSCYAANSCCQIILCCQQLLSDHTVVRQCTIWMCCRMVLVAVCLAFLRAKVFLNS